MQSTKDAREDEPFVEFTKTQTQLNFFFWSSELSYALVRQKLIRKSLQGADAAVTEAFTGLAPIPHAFVKNTKGKAKYQKKLSEFDEHLERNFEPLSRYVIFRFHTALEHYLTRRMRPFADAYDASGEPVPWKIGKSGRGSDLLKDLQKTNYHKLQSKLEKICALRRPILEEAALRAQTYRLLRNSSVHSNVVEYYDKHWPEEAFRKKIAKADIFTHAQKTYIAREITEKIRKKCDERRDTPPLFFYALFMLTDYRNFAQSVEAALPPLQS